VIIINHAGPRLSFGQAVEKAKDAGMNIESYIFGDDCADTGGRAGKRGVTGCVLFFKVSKSHLS
jgi:dihydroxyacetone kinase